MACVLVGELAQRPVFARARVAGEREARASLGRRVMAERGKRARLRRGRGHEVRRQRARLAARAGEHAEQRGARIVEPLLHLAAQRVKVGGGALQHEHVGQAERHAGERVAAQAESGTPDRRTAQEVVELHQHLDRHAERQHLGQLRVVRHAELGAVELHQRAREIGEALGREQARAAGVEEGVVPLLGVFALGLQARRRDRLGKRDEPRQARAVGGERLAAVVEYEGTEIFFAEPRQQRLDAAPAARGQSARGQGAPEQRRERLEVDAVVAPGERGAQGLRAAALVGARPVGGQDVAEPALQPLDAAAQRARLFLLERAPRMRHQAPGERFVAVGELAVHGERHGSVPQPRELAAGAAGEHRAQLALAPQRLLACLLVAALERCVHHARQPVQGAVLRQHQGKVVAQRREVAVARQQRRSQLEGLERLRACGELLPGEVEGELRLEISVHARATR